MKFWKFLTPQSPITVSFFSSLLASIFSCLLIFATVLLPHVILTISIPFCGLCLIELVKPKELSEIQYLIDSLIYSTGRKDSDQEVWFLALFPDVFSDIQKLQRYEKQNGEKIFPILTRTIIVKSIHTEETNDTTGPVRSINAELQIFVLWPEDLLRFSE